MAAWLHNPSGKLEIDGGKGGGATKGCPVPSISKFQLVKGKAPVAEAANI